MRESEIKASLADAGAIITDSHIVYTSGKHGSAYVNKDAVYPDTELTSRLCQEIASRFADEEPDVEAVIAPAVGGVILSQWTAYHLSKFCDKKIHALYAERGEGDEFVIKRGYEKIVPGRRILVVEDILNTGDSAQKVVDAVRRIGGEVIGVGVLCNRGGVTKEILSVPRLEALLTVTMDSFDPHDCPLCKADVPINTSVGHGKKFLAEKQAIIE